MSNETNASKRPTHRIYVVTKRKTGDESDWAEIGAAWAHADGKGFSLKLNMLPLNGGDIVIREPKPRADGGAQ